MGSVLDFLKKTNSGEVITSEDLNSKNLMTAVLIMAEGWRSDLYRWYIEALEKSGDDEKVLLPEGIVYFLKALINVGIDIDNFIVGIATKMNEIQERENIPLEVVAVCALCLDFIKEVVLTLTDPETDIEEKRIRVMRILKKQADLGRLIKNSLIILEGVDCIDNMQEDDCGSKNYLN